jgi:hypothetical protein
LPLPPLIRDAFELLAREEEDALVQLAAIRTLRGWLGECERAGLAAARAQDYSWEEIGRAQGRPRQAVQRQASRQAQRPRVLGLTGPDFVGVATPELQVWLSGGAPAAGRLRVQGSRPATPSASRSGSGPS